MNVLWRSPVTVKYIFAAGILLYSEKLLERNSVRFLTIIYRCSLSIYLAANPVISLYQPNT